MRPRRRGFVRAVCVVAFGTAAGCVGSPESAPPRTSVATSEYESTIGSPEQTPSRSETDTVEVTPPTERRDGTTTPRPTSDAPAETPYETTWIPALISGDEIVETEQVPVAWKEQHDRAEDVIASVREEYGDLEGIRSSGIVNAEETIGGLHYAAIEIGVAPEHAETVDEAIPDRIEDVPIDVVSQEHTAVIPEAETVLSGNRTTTG